jgi:hypothetical protein
MSKAAEYFRMLAGIYSDQDRWDSAINPDVIAWCRQAATAIEATTPRPWPPPPEVERCLIWRSRGEGWLVAEWMPVSRWWSLDPKHCELDINPPQFWQPMPPEPEVGP